MFALRPPATTGDLQSSLGAAVFYATFIPDFAAVADPLRKVVHLAGTDVQIQDDARTSRG